MGLDVKLPDLGDGIKSADILEVLVHEGDEISKDQSVVEIETDKATVEVPSPQAGKVAQIHVKAGETVAVGATLVTLEAADATTAAPPAAAPPKRETPPAPAAPPAPAPVAEPAAAAPPPIPTPAAAPPMSAVTPARTEASSPTAAAEKTVPVAAGPAIRRFAREVGVDLTTVQGSGEGGRITREDVLDVVRHANKMVQAGQDHDTDINLPGTPSTDDWGPIRVEQAPRIRQTIARKMHESWSTAARVTNFDDADVTELEKIRQTSKADYAARGIKLTSMPFIIKAVSMSLRNHPLMNASYDAEENQIVYKRYVNVGVAVDTDRGLVVPVVRNTDQSSIAEAAKELAALAEQVRENNFSLDDLKGGTFTISNLGAIGGTYSTPIVNVPEVGILLVGRSRKMPVVVDDEVQIRLMMPLSLSYDHRLIDGATAARFLNDVIDFLQAPGRLLLAP